MPCARRKRARREHDGDAVLAPGLQRRRSGTLLASDCLVDRTRRDFPGEVQRHPICLGSEHN